MARNVYLVGPGQALAESLGEGIGSMFASMRDNAERRRRREEVMAFVEDLQERITRSQDLETAQYVLKRFEDSNYSPEFNFLAEVQDFQRKRIYDFAINFVSEGFADALIERMRKFASIEYDASMNEIIERTLNDVGFEGDESQEATRLLEAFPQYLSEKRKRKTENVRLVQEHIIGGRTISEYSDGRFELKTISGGVKTFSTLSEAKRYIS